MIDMIRRAIADLMKVKTIITIVVTAIFAYLTLNGEINPDQAMTVITMVFAFYFGTQHERKTPKDGEK